VRGSSRGSITSRLSQIRQSVRASLGSPVSQEASGERLSVAGVQRTRLRRYVQEKHKTGGARPPSRPLKTIPGSPARCELQRSAQSKLESPRSCKQPGSSGQQLKVERL
jgi:hypothetical protein